MGLMTLPFTFLIEREREGGRGGGGGEVPFKLELISKSYYIIKQTIKRASDYWRLYYSE